MEEAAMSTEDKAKAEHTRHVDKIRQREQSKRTAEMKEKLEERKAQRRVEAQLKNARALGEAVNDRDDDVLAWMQSHKAKQSETDAAAAEQQDDATQKFEQDELDVSNVAMKASAVDLNEGETRILTLADASILGDDGRIAEDGDVLEDAGRSRAEMLARKKRAAQPQALHFEEDSKRLGLLSKYDEEESEALVVVSRDGTLDDEEVRASIAARLRASAPGAAGAAGGVATATAAAVPPAAAREYLHASEAGFREKRGKKRKTGKARKARVEEDEDEPRARTDGGNTGASVFDELEASGVVTGGDSGRGSRAAKRQRDAAAAAADAAEEDEKAARYELALEKANRAASGAARRADVATGHLSDEEDEEEQQLMASLAKAARVREAAQEGKSLEAAVLDEVAAEVAVGDSEKVLEDDTEGRWHTTDTIAFIDSLNTLEATAAEDQAMHDADAIRKDVDAKPELMEEDEPAPPKPPQRRQRRNQAGGWEVDPAAAAELAAAENAQKTAADDQKAPKRRMRGRRNAEDEETPAEGSAAAHAHGGDAAAQNVDGVKEEPDDKSHVLFELQKGLGRGLAEALVVVRERGWLNEVEYRGRISDFKHNQKDLVEDALLSDSSALAHRVGASLQRKDEFGRILTPKEVFRDVSYAFHGYKRAASKKEKNLKSLQNSRAQAGLLDETNVPYHQSVNPSQLLDDWKARKWRPKWVNYKQNAKVSKKSAGRKGGLNDSLRDGVSAALDGSANKIDKSAKKEKAVEQSNGWAAETLESNSVAELPARKVAGEVRKVDGGLDGTTAAPKKVEKEMVLPPPPPPME